MHRRVALDRPANDASASPSKIEPPAIGYQETIRTSITSACRHNKQSGVHGQFGDVCWRSSPMPRGCASSFTKMSSVRLCGATRIISARVICVACRWIAGAGRWSFRSSTVHLDVDATVRYHSVDSSILRSVPRRDRRQRWVTGMPAGAAGADPCGGDLLSDRCHREDQRRSSRSARAYLGFRHPTSGPVLDRVFAP